MHTLKHTNTHIYNTYTHILMIKSGNTVCMLSSKCELGHSTAMLAQASIHVSSGQSIDWPNSHFVPYKCIELLNSMNMYITVAIHSLWWRQTCHHGSTPIQFIWNREKQKMADKLPEFGGYDLNFTSEPPDALKCLICYSVAREPWQHATCGRLFCCTCLQEHRKENSKCPICRVQNAQYFQDRKSKWN